MVDNTKRLDNSVLHFQELSKLWRPGQRQKNETRVFFLQRHPNDVDFGPIKRRDRRSRQVAVLVGDSARSANRFWHEIALVG